MGQVLDLKVDPTARLLKEFMEYAKEKSLLRFFDTCCGDDRRDAICAEFVRFASQQQLIARSMHGYYSSNDLLAKLRYFFPHMREQMGADTKTIVAKLLETFSRNHIKFERIFPHQSEPASVHHITARRP